MDKQKHKDKAKKVKNDMVANLEPVIKKGVQDFIDVGKEFIEDALTTFFENKKTGKKKKE